jgi:hypothetical protein
MDDEYDENSFKNDLESAKKHNDTFKILKEQLTDLNDKMENFSVNVIDMDDVKILIIIKDQYLNLIKKLFDKIDNGKHLVIDYIFLIWLKKSIESQMKTLKKCDVIDSMLKIEKNISELFNNKTISYLENIHGNNNDVPYLKKLMRVLDERISITFEQLELLSQYCDDIMSLLCIEKIIFHCVINVNIFIGISKKEIHRFLKTLYNELNYDNFNEFIEKNKNKNEINYLINFNNLNKFFNENKKEKSVNNFNDFMNCELITDNFKNNEKYLQKTISENLNVLKKLNQELLGFEIKQNDIEEMKKRLNKFEIDSQNYVNAINEYIDTNNVNDIDLTEYEINIGNLFYKFINNVIVKNRGAKFDNYVTNIGNILCELDLLHTRSRINDAIILNKDIKNNYLSILKNCRTLESLNSDTFNSIVPSVKILYDHNENFECLKFKNKSENENIEENKIKENVSSNRDNRKDYFNKNNITDINYSFNNDKKNNSSVNSIIDDNGEIITKFNKSDKNNNHDNIDNNLESINTIKKNDNDEVNPETSNQNLDNESIKRKRNLDEEKETNKDINKKKCKINEKNISSEKTKIIDKNNKDDKSKEDDKISIGNEKKLNDDKFYKIMSDLVRQEVEKRMEVVNEDKKNMHEQMRKNTELASKCVENLNILTNSVNNLVNKDKTEELIKSINELVNKNKNEELNLIRDGINTLKVFTIHTKKQSDAINHLIHNSTKNINTDEDNDDSNEYIIENFDNLYEEACKKQSVSFFDNFLNDNKSNEESEENSANNNHDKKIELKDKTCNSFVSEFSCSLNNIRTNVNSPSSNNLTKRERKRKESINNNVVGSSSSSSSINNFETDNNNNNINTQFQNQKNKNIQEINNGKEFLQPPLNHNNNTCMNSNIDNAQYQQIQNTNIYSNNSTERIASSPINDNSMKSTRVFPPSLIYPRNFKNNYFPPKK